MCQVSCVSCQLSKSKQPQALLNSFVTLSKVLFCQQTSFPALMMTERMVVMSGARGESGDVRGGGRAHNGRLQESSPGPGRDGLRDLSQQVKW